MSRDFDNEICRQIYEKYGCTLDDAFVCLFHRALRKTRSLDDADDLTHDALLRLIETDPGDPVINWKSYMVAVVDRLYFDSFRGGHSCEMLSGNVPECPTKNPGPEDRVVYDDHRRTVWEAVKVLKKKYREVMQLRYNRTFEIMRKYSEIATMLGVSEGTVASRLYYARKELRRILESGDGEGS